MIMRLCALRNVACTAALLRVIALGSGLFVSSESQAAELNPPPPDPAAPVDYLAWINKAVGGEVKKKNAAETYKAAYALIQPFDQDWPPEVLAGPWENHEPVSKWLEANKKGLNKFREAAKMRECFFALEPPPATGDERSDGSLMRVLLPSFRSHRDACKGLIALSFQNQSKSDPKRMLKEALLITHASHHLAAGHPTLIARLVGASCSDLAYAAIRQTLYLAKAPDAVAQSMLPELEESDPGFPPFREGCLSERLNAWDICQRLFVPRSSVGWALHSPLAAGLRESLESKELDEGKLLQIGFEKTLQEINAYFDALDRWAQTPYPQAAGQADQFDRLTSASTNPLAKNILPNLTRARLFDERITAERRATHLIIYLLAQHKKTGTFPESIDQVSAPGLDKLRVDPFSERDFAYRQMENGFTLYSVAENLIDDAGRHDPKWVAGDFVFWPLQP